MKQYSIPDDDILIPSAVNFDWDGFKSGLLKSLQMLKEKRSNHPELYGSENDSGGLDIAIGEYAPGRAVVVDKQTYQIGGLYYPGSERRKGKAYTPAQSFTEDPNYIKDISSCSNCGWFGLSNQTQNADMKTP